MKKLSLLLALMLVLTCGVLAACGGETDDTSSEAPATSSEAPTSSEEPSADPSVEPSEDPSVEPSEDPSAEPSEDPSVEPSEDPSEDSSVEPVVDPFAGTNVAGDATYTISDLYRQGGADTEWGWDPNADIAYPDKEGVDMNDGIYPTVKDFYDEAWIGFHGKTPSYIETGYHTITFTFEEAVTATGLKLYVSTADLGGGIAAPSSIDVYASNDGENWSIVGTATPANVSTADFGDLGVEVVEIPVLIPTEATQYQIRLVSGEAWAFVSEVEIFA